MAVAAVVVLALHRMVHVSGRQRHIGREKLERFEQDPVDMPAMQAPLHSFAIAPELRGPLDGVHEGKPRRRPQSSRLSSASASAGVPSSTSSPRRLDGLDGGVVGYQRPEVGPATRRRLLKNDAHGLTDGEAPAPRAGGRLRP